MKLTLVIGFFFTAAIYAAVGFGGGSTYTALLAVSGVPFVIIPIVSLICNICVVGGNSWRYLRGQHVKLSEVWPIFILSIPAAFLGGGINVSELLFLALLSFALFLAGLRLVFAKVPKDAVPNLKAERRLKLSGIIGGCIGFYSGIVGIGGGIFLAPILYRLRWGTALNIAATSSLFILVNSIAGLAGQIIKHSSKPINADILSYWPLVVAVLIGGTIGNISSIRVLKPEHLRRITGVLILIVAIRLSFKWFSLL